MTPLKFDIYEDLKWRGLIYQSTDENLQAWLNEKPRTVYVGFDPTADSLHVGSLLPLQTLRRFQLAGHRPVAIIGGATGMIGDPSGKSAERNLLSEVQLQANIAGMQKQMEAMLDFDCGEHSAVLVNNYDWMKNFSYIEFLRDVGKNFPVNVMLAKDSVKSRLGSDAGISYTEFSYMLLQAYDFVHLNQQYGCELQIGGSDQWGNVTAGIDLGRRMQTTQLFGLTLPLLTKSDGSKMGKTETGTVWLSGERTSPYELYQYWVRVDDADVGKCLRYLTDLEREQIDELDQLRESVPHQRDSQKRLAEELTRQIHGEAGLAAAKHATEVFFGAEITECSERDLNAIFSDVPSKQVSRSLIAGEGLPVYDAFVEAGLCQSKGEARRLFAQGGLYINNHRWADDEARLTSEQLVTETTMVLRSGKKKYALLKFELE
jgi:tyrosyl-tRNA synthetase